MPVTLHRPPGLVKDLNSESKKKWSRRVSSFMRLEPISPTVTPQFYDATKVDRENAIETAVVTWIGFPKQCRWPNDEERWRAADESRRVQDEYLEWSVKRNNDNKITKIVFSNEGPEYFQCLGINQPETLLALYQELNPDAEIVKTDLYREFKRPNGTSKQLYKRDNKWNNSTKTGKIMHLIHDSNTLSAEVILAAEATIVRKRADGTIITDVQELINCSRHAEASRNSDPHIAICCNNLVRELPRRLTINDPIGLYIHSVNWGMVDPPEGHEDDDPSTFWKWTRGSDGRYVRAEFEVPADKGYVVGDLLVNGKPLKYGAQLTDYILVSLTAKTSAWDGKAEPQIWPPPNAFNLSSTAHNT